jgi:hypothetical protein
MSCYRPQEAIRQLDILLWRRFLVPIDLQTVRGASNSLPDAATKPSTRRYGSSLRPVVVANCPALYSCWIRSAVRGVYSCRRFCSSELSLDLAPIPRFSSHGCICLERLAIYNTG